MRSKVIPTKNQAIDSLAGLYREHPMQKLEWPLNLLNYLLPSKQQVAGSNPAGHAIFPTTLIFEFRLFRLLCPTP